MKTRRKLCKECGCYSRHRVWCTSKEAKLKLQKLKGGVKE